MHNCRLTKNRLIDLTLDEVGSAEAKQLLAELDDCPACKEEYATLRSTLRVSAQALRAELPSEDFWSGHQARRQLRLRNDLSRVQLVRLSLSARGWIALRRMATTTVRVPVPAALAIMVLIGVFFFALPSRGQENLTSSTPLASVEIRTVQVPVIQEKLVTRVVYLEKKGRRYKGAAGQPALAESNPGNNLASARPDAYGKTAMSLIGFKPTNQIKLTIIKGTDQDEK